uniref:Uncharacterized protein n=1 Tax=Arundo donax TaxID=35708 RepID=A0A0A9FR22_ARUDO
MESKGSTKHVMNSAILIITIEYIHQEFRINYYSQIELPL